MFSSGTAPSTLVGFLEVRALGPDRSFVYYNLIFEYCILLLYLDFNTFELSSFIALQALEALLRLSPLLILLVLLSRTSVVLRDVQVSS